MIRIVTHRTTLMLPDGLHARLRREADRRGVSLAEVAREKLEAGFADRTRPGRLSFFAIGEGDPDDVSERVDEFVGRALARRRSGARRARHGA
jgi:hypothetical protein